MRYLTAVLCAWLLASCGGGGGGGATGGSPAPVAQCAPFSDSFGIAVSCAEMNALAGASLPFLEGSGGDGAGDGGADGGAGDGAPIANTDLKFTDINGKTVTTKTDANGYYRISLRGLKAPLVATVLRNNKPWKSMLVADIVRAPANRKFYTINLTGLTDYVVSEVAKKEGLSSPDAITPQAVASQKAQIPTIITAINNTLSAQLAAVGLNASSFNPLNTPFQAVLTDNYDKLLESVAVVRDPTSGSTVVTPAYSVGGNISGLGNATGLTLINGTATLPISASSSTFVFTTKLAQNANYNVTVGTQPSGLTCAVNNGSGTMGTATVNNVAVVCSAITYTLGGSVTGLGSATGLQLANGVQVLTIAPNQTVFAFTNGVAQGTNYAVAVQTQPPGLTCSVSGGSGTMGNAPITNAQVNCSVNSYALGGSINGLSANGLVLASGGQTLTVAANATTFAFPTPVASGSTYAVTVQTQPTNMTCNVSNGTGTVTSSAVTSVAVSCTINKFSLGGGVTGLSTSGLVLASNGQTLSVASGSTSFVFPAPIASGTSYNVSVQTQPANMTCSVSGGSGTIVSNPVSNVGVNCSVNSYTLGGTISGLGANNVVLASNGQTAVGVASASGSNFVFATPIASGTNYNVSVQTQPAGQNCTVSSGAGVMTSAPVTSVLVSCTNIQYTVTATVTGVTGTGMVLTNGTQNISAVANVVNNINFGPYLSGAAYNITVQTQPVGQICTVSNGVGIISSVSLNNVSVSCSSAGPTVSTLAGTGSLGFVNGIGTGASFKNPTGVTVDSNGNVFVADTDNNSVRKITPSGVVSTFAGTGSPGFVNGIGTGASFKLGYPSGVAVDSIGNVFVADSVNFVIRKITPAGVVSTFAGTGSPGFVNGTGTGASFNLPSGVAVDSSGNVFVADTWNYAIRKITPAGVVSTFAGTGSPGFVNGTGTGASFGSPESVAVDSLGNVYVGDILNYAIRKITPAGVVSTFAGNGLVGFVNGTGTGASFNLGLGVAVDISGNVFVADSGNNTIRKITPAGVVSTFAGNGLSGFVNGTGTGANFRLPIGVTVDSSGNVFVADQSNNAIRKITP